MRAHLALLLMLPSGCSLDWTYPESGAGGAGAAQGGGQASGGGGAGGAEPACGNGIIETGEECDDGNDDGADLCAACTVNCAGDNQVKDSATLTCCCRTADMHAWSVANTVCEELGGALAVIRSEDERTLVLPLVNGDVWLGASKSDADWVWVTGETLEQNAPWASMNERNESGCLAFAEDGHFYAEACDIHYRGICEIPPIGERTD